MSDSSGPGGSDVPTVRFAPRGAGGGGADGGGTDGGAGGSWRRWVRPLAAAAALGMHLTVGVAYAASGLLAPVWAVVVLGLWWLLLGALLLVLAARRSLWCLAVPAVALASWVLAISAGGAWLGWTA